ncbi:heparan-alpha-glucosaminide N-acetyltransferase domain-containing protein [Alteromonas sp. CyTr2]|uniref:heparan-alpha-glucosaminide N-acetyltransferase domain-containing protein n=1 Tax=Alteromonas sp. CyTr2 TaxID=2935039 RepID=UPI00248DC86B|nr:heparan-alpha-glucosaminide N-acetyltransferase domain-containing protein [Alteromonas sp. CyTr2]
MKLFYVPSHFGTPSINRQKTFDVAKGVAVLLMVMIHVLDFYGLPEVRFSAFGSTVKFALGWPAASMFVFIMGIFVGLSPSSTLKADIKRAISLFVLGYALNFVRGTIPMWLSIKIGLVTYQDVAPHTPLSEFLIGDVFQFAGIALLLCTGLKHATNKISIWIGTAIAIAFLSHSVWDRYTSLPILNEFLKLFVGNEEAGVMFPIFPWAAYPIAGMAFGRFLKQHNKGTLNFVWCLKLGVVCVILGTGLTLTNPEYHIVTNLRSGPGIVLLMTGIVMLFIYTTHILVERFKQNYVVTLFAFWGKNVTALYVLQWILIGWGLMLVGLQQLTMTFTLVAMIVVLLACHYLVLPWHEYKAKSSKASKPHVSAVPLKP